MALDAATVAKLAEYLEKARSAYERMLQEESGGAWRNVNVAVFFNNEIADFDAAERQAQKALAIMDLPMARYHLAAARYQRLLVRSKDLARDELQAQVTTIGAETGVALAQAIAFESFSALIRSRLQGLADVVARKSS